MKNKVMVISGKQYSGKDTVAKILLEAFTDFRRIGIGDSIKIEYGKKNNLTFEEIEAQKHLYREDLIKLGNWGRGIHPDFWLKKILELDYNIIVPDVRVTHEVEMFRDKSAYLIRVEATKESREARGKITNENDLTETELDNYNKWNYIINNSGSYTDLQEAIKPLIVQLSSWILH